MKRTIIGYRRDEDNHHVAVLDCGHGRHLRHDPPTANRPWADDPTERAKRMGTEVDCLKCDRSELPDDAEPYKSTRWFTEDTVPRALLSVHSTKKGTWGRIEVAEGALRYVAGPPAEADVVLTPGVIGIGPPQHPHRVEPVGSVRFRVVFLRCPPPAAP